MPNKLGGYRISVEAHIIALIFTLILIFASLFVPVNINNKEELNAVHLDLPFRFIVQNQTSYDPPFPAKVRFYSPWENPPEVNGLNLLLSIAVVFIVLEVGVFTVEKIKKQKMRFF